MLIERSSHSDEQLPEYCPLYLFPQNHNSFAHQGCKEPITQRMGQHMANGAGSRINPTLFSLRESKICFKSCSVKSLHERSNEWRWECLSTRILANAFADSLPIEFADKFKSVIVLLLCSPSSKTRPPSSTNLLRRRLRQIKESFPRRARPRYRPPYEGDMTLN